MLTEFIIFGIRSGIHILMILILLATPSFVSLNHCMNDDYNLLLTSLCSKVDGLLEQMCTLVVGLSTLSKVVS